MDSHSHSLPFLTLYSPQLPYCTTQLACPTLSKAQSKHTNVSELLYAISTNRGPSQQTLSHTCPGISVWLLGNTEDSGSNKPHIFLMRWEVKLLRALLMCFIGYSWVYQSDGCMIGLLNRGINLLREWYDWKVGWKTGLTSFPKWNRKLKIYHDFPWAEQQPRWQRYRPHYGFNNYFLNLADRTSIVCIN